jgi:streptogramin lyase
MAWTSGTLNEQNCTIEGAKVWTTGAVANSAGSTHALRLDGESGEVDLDVHIPEVCVGASGPYGGAVDEDNNFWFHSRDCVAPAPLVRVDADGGSYDVYDVPSPVHPYGITVDSNGRIWLAGYIGGLARFDPDTETFDVLPGVTGLGIQEDGQGRMWMAVYPWDNFRGVHAFDVDTMQIIKTIDMTQVTPSSRGISIDFEGYVWMVDQHQSAWKIDADANTWEHYDGLTGPYTYSDMTGWGLKLVNPG